MASRASAGANGRQLTDRLDSIEGRVGAAHSAARVIATLPPAEVARQVARVADRLGLDHATVTSYVVEAVCRDDDAPGRLARRDRRDDLDRDQAMTTGPAQPQPQAQAGPVRLARAAYPAPLPQAARRAPAGGEEHTSTPAGVAVHTAAVVHRSAPATAPGAAVRRG